MAKKENKKAKEPKPKKEPKAKGKKGKEQEAAAAAAAPPAGDVPPTGTPSNGAPSAPGAVPPAGAPTVPLSAMMPDQMTAQQLEQAIKESNDPESRLKKLNSPLSVKSCLLNLLFLVILTLAIVILWCWIAVDKFNFGVVAKDMLDVSGITGAFEGMWDTITGWFSGGGG